MAPQTQIAKMISLELQSFTDLYTLVFTHKQGSAEISGLEIGNVKMEEKRLDFVLVPLGMAILLSYHLWLLITILRNPRRTVIGLNAESRHKWVFCVMAVSLLSSSIST